jgi:UDP-N-acetylmuramate: L-alanyl-gamma-D-glutamyl-meso-diaminopimelate ligase
MSIRNQKIHFIAIGGGTMHPLAIALKNNGNEITGSDDEIFDPSRSRLAEAGLLPEKEGWFPEKNHSGLDLVVVGMHAREDNPELKKAHELNLKVLSFPELIFHHARNKQRIVIAGSHGKTTTTAMIMHVLKFAGRKFDFLVGAPVPGFDNTIRLSDEAPIMVMEGDEYYSSPELATPKFLVYQHHIGLVTGISWDHINIFPTEHSYVRQFDHFADSTPKAGILVYNDEDALTSVICKKEREDVTVLEYGTPKHTVRNGKTYWITSDGKEIPLQIFGAHNLNNANGARTLLTKLGIHDDQFFEAMQSFTGASRRLEKMVEGKSLTIYRDFAHAPSKLKATIEAVKSNFPSKKSVAVMELHTFSSLNKDFLPTYAHSMDDAAEAYVYYNPQVVAHKKLEPVSEEEIRKSFGRPDLQIFTDSEKLFQHLDSKTYDNSILILMSSGNFNGTDLPAFARALAEKN